MRESQFDIFVEIVTYIFDYLLNIKLFEVPSLLFYVFLIAVVGYCAALMIVGIPCSIFEKITKKKVREDIEKKIIVFVSICLSIAFVMLLAYGEIA